MSGLIPGKMPFIVLGALRAFVVQNESFKGKSLSAFSYRVSSADKIVRVPGFLGNMCAGKKEDFLFKLSVQCCLKSIKEIRK